MWSPLATLLLTWAAIYAYVAAYFCALYIRRPTQRERLAFGLFSLAMSVWGIGSTIGADAQNLARATLALRVQYAGGFPAAALFLHFACLVSGQRRPRLVRAGYAIGALGLAMDGLGLLFDATPRAVTWGHVRLELAVEPTMTWYGGLVVLAAVTVAGLGVATLVGSVARAPDLRPLTWTMGAAVLAGGYDNLARIFGWPTLFLVDHVALLPILTVSLLLQKRHARAADELGERTDELRTSYSELRIVQEELVRKEQLAAVGGLSAVIAHEVRNPLAIIKNAVSGLRRATLRPADRSVLLGILEEEVDRLSRLVRDLLAYARPVAPEAEDVPLRGIVEKAIEAVGRHQEVDEVEVDLRIDPELMVHADADLLEQALTHVTANALQAMPDGGTLTIEASSVGTPAQVRLSLTDTGAGMDALVLKKAQDPFFTTRPAGTGLGLAIVNRVAKTHGGEVEIESELGGGATITLVLPTEPVDRTSLPPSGNWEIEG